MDEVAERRDSVAVLGVFLSLVAVLGAVFSVGLAVRAIDEADDAGGGAAAATTVEVTLSEFAIEPGAISLPAGATLVVRNGGSVAHDLTVKDTDLTTSTIEAGDASPFDVSSLAAGTYAVFCSIPGHEAAGMSGTLTIGGAGAGVAAGTSPSHAEMSAEEMDATMKARTLEFPQKTEGVGATELAPTVLADGTKEFHLTASEIDWEVEQGKVVKAMAYNGQVPGPTIRVGVGDRVRIVLRNEMSQSTVLHPHGLILPNAMDGVPDITQDPIKPGEAFTYEFVTREPMVAMYHSHHNAQVQVPNGLLGAFYVGEMPLPAGTPEPVISAPMVLNDGGTIGYSLNGKSFPATAPYAVKQGDWIRLDYMNEGLQIHPMHLHGIKQLVIAKDGFPLPNPQYEDTVTVAPGERLSVLIQATERGVWAWHCHILNHAERADGMFGMVTALVVE
jgi:FtsP/CotA-like multicopper oxidase with cupredoxin domain/plastocyanin